MQDSHGCVPEGQAELGHVALLEVHGLQLRHGEQLLPRVDDLTLQIHSGDR